MKLRHNRIITDALREIRNTFSRFLSLLVLSALAVCFLAGLRATAPDMKKSADLYFDQQNLMDLHVLSTLGLTDKDAEALAQQPGVAAVERAYTVDAVVHLTDNDYIVKVLSFTEDPGINAPRLVEGRLPQNARECLVEPLLLEETGLQLGDTLTLDTGDGDYADALRTEAFTIVGTADSPLYVGTDRGTSSLGTGKVSAFVLLPLSAFSMETYTDFYLLAEGTESLLCYDDAYTDRIDSLTDSLEAFADPSGPASGERRSSARPTNSWRRRSRSWRTHRRRQSRSSPTPGRSWQMPGPSWMTAGRNTTTASGSCRTRWQRQSRRSLTARRSWTTPWWS